MNTNAAKTSNSWATAPASPFTLNALSLSVATSYYLCIRAVDKSGNKSDPRCSLSWQADTSAPGTLTVGSRGITASSVTITWSNSSDAQSGIDYYETSISTLPLGTGSLLRSWRRETASGCYNADNCITDTGVPFIIGNSYYLNVRAWNRAGLSSIASATAYVPVPITVSFKYNYAESNGCYNDDRIRLCTQTKTLLDTDLISLQAAYPTCSLSSTATAYTLDCTGNCVSFPLFCSSSGAYKTHVSCSSIARTSNYSCSWSYP